MTFQELQLAMAISKAGTTARDAIPRVEQLEMMAGIQRVFTLVFDGEPFPFNVDEVIRMATTLRKSPSARIKADVAMIHGHRCFWHGRNKGPCTEDAECGHLVPNSSGGELSVANCVIECRGHNNQRSNRTIEQYIDSELSQ